MSNQCRDGNHSRFRIRARILDACLLAYLIGSAVASGQTDPPSVSADSPADADSRPTLYVTATAHLDTQWLWTIQDTINEYIPDTLRGNFALFEKYPNYTFSFEGAFRYMLAKEYYPQDYAKLKEYVRQGRWRVCGSSIDAGDVNVPSPESLIRHVLYGNLFFEREFDRRSEDIYLPDCFGFGYALPSIASHCGLKGFSTQKLTWGSSVGIPFDVGVWEGVDGSAIVAALNPGAYVSKLRNDLSVDADWLKRINELGAQSGVYVGYKYFGVGDVGGAPDDESVQWLERAIANDGPIRIINTSADQLYKDLSPAQIAKLPRYKGEMLMTRHGTGTYTSQAAMKRWNRKNEQLADATERASVIADWLGAADYPREKLEQAWVRVLWHQFHDDLPGTCIPQAYTFSWNDELISLNQFATELTHAVGASARALDTRAVGVPLIVFNPLAFEREDVVEATIAYPKNAPPAVRVYDGAGREVPSQVSGTTADTLRIVFLARVPSVGLAVFDVRPASEPCVLETGLNADESGVENSRYRIRFDENGDIASLYDKSLQRELLAGPARLQMLHDTPDRWSEWEVWYDDITAEPYAHFADPTKIRVIEHGPARVVVEIVRETADSTITQRIRLSAGGAADRADVETVAHWYTPATLLKAAFPLSVANERATYDLGFGVIERRNNTENKYEVPAQQWADLTAADGSYGVAIMNDCKYGWDKPDDNTLRLTLIHCPNDVEKDMGWHKFTYSLYGHKGRWQESQVVRQAARLNQPLVAFQTGVHAGALGTSLSFLTVSSPHVVVRALKMAEQSDEIVVRLQESHGREVRSVVLQAVAPIESAREMTGAEQPLGRIEVQNGRLVLDFKPFQPRTLAVKLQRVGLSIARSASAFVQLPFDTDVISSDGNRSDGDFDGLGRTLPAELIPETIVCGGVPFRPGPKHGGVDNAVTCRGQTIALPSGRYDRLYLLAAAATGRTTGEFRIGDPHSGLSDPHDGQSDPHGGQSDPQGGLGPRSTTISVHGFSGWTGQSSSLVVGDRVVQADGMASAFIHRDEVAWVGTHRHDARSDRNEPYVFCYLFRYGADIPPGASSITLPDNADIRILAMTVVDDPTGRTMPAGYLYDHIIGTHIEPRGGLYIDPVTVRLSSEDTEAEIVFTLDGSDPDADSPRYAGPIALSKTATVRARAVRDGILDEQVTRATFTFTKPRPAEQPSKVAQGLRYRYFKGAWDKLPDFDALTPVFSGTMETVGLPPEARQEDIGVALSGYIEVPREGVYTFYTTSDDGSRLYIGDELVVDSDGLHGPKERAGKIAIAAGLHHIRVTFFQHLGGVVLRADYEGPGIDKQPIPAAALNHSTESRKQ